MGCGISNNLMCHRKTKGKLSKSEKALRAAILIQRWYRRYLARIEIRRRCTWNIFQRLEYAGEQDQLKLYDFFIDLISHLNEFSPNHKLADVISQSPRHLCTSDDEAALLAATDPTPIKVESSYKGPHLCFPLTKKDLENLIEAFKRKRVLHARYTLQLLHEARRLLKTKPNINLASTSLARQVTVCGDLHGKLDDLLVIFHKNGLPCVENPYVFNGDFVDRGRSSVEVFLLLLAFFLLLPNEVYLNRGNHEDHVMNFRYGFTNEVMYKYKNHASKIILLLEDLFSWLPLATIIDQKILVVHGGVSDTTDLQRLSAVDRHQFISLLKPPVKLDRPEEDLRDILEDDDLTYDWRMVLDLLWSDPMTQNGCEANTFRGGGVYFGPDITSEVLLKNNLRLLIRSHECKPEGYEYTHNEQCLTIFSASNYYDFGSNRGAYVKFIGPDLCPEFVQYYAPKARKLTIMARVGLIEKSALNNLRQTISASKSPLLQEFQKYDTENVGLIRVSEWCVVMETVLKLNLPWRMLKERLVKMDEESGLVEYASTCDQVTLDTLKHNADSPGVVETLYRHKSSLETIFRIIDKDNSGSISMEEFQDACELLGRHLGTQLPEDHIRDIAASIDINKDGQIDINEFLEAFRLVDRGMNCNKNGSMFDPLIEEEEEAFRVCSKEISFSQNELIVK